MPVSSCRAVLLATVLGAAVACGPGQRPATFPAPPPVSMAAETEVKVGLVAVDPDGDAVTLALGSGAPAWAKLEGTVLTLTPKREDVGEKSIEVIANSLPSPTTATVKVSVTAGANRAPVLDDIAPITVAEGEKKTVTVSATDPDGDAVTFKLIGAAPSWVTLEGTTLGLAPDFDGNGGSGTLTVRAQDPSGAFGEKTVTVTITNVDREPTVEGPPAGNVAEGETGAFPFRGRDPDGDAVTFQLASGAPAFASLEANSGVLTVKPGFDAAGSYTLDIVANANGKTAHQSFSLLVSNTNRPPQLARLNDLTITGGDSGTVTLTGTDPDGDALTFQASGSPYVSVAGSALSYAVPQTADAGQADVTVNADDGKGGTASTMFRLSVLKLQTPPTVAALVQKQNDADVAGGTAIGTGGLTLGATVADLQNDKVNLQIELRPSNTAFSNIPTSETGLMAAGALTVQLPPQPVGSYHWQVRAVDATGLASAWTAFADDPAYRVTPQQLSGGLSLDEVGFTNHRLVTAHVSAASAPGAQLATMAFSLNGQVFDAERSFAETATYLLDPTEGAQTLYVRVTDTLGNTGTFSTSVTYDATAPVSALELLASASLVNSTTVALHLTSTDVASGLSRACFSNDGLVFLASDCQSAQAVIDRSWTLASGDGLKIVFAKVTDRAGNTAYATVAVQLDQTPPVLQVTPAVTGSAISSPNVPLLVTATDASGIAESCLAQDSDPFLDADCGALAARVRWSLTGGEGQHTIRVRVTDAAGNSTTVTTDPFTYDATPPTVTLSATGLANVSGKLYAKSRTVSLSLAAGTDATGVKTMQFSNDGLSWSAEEDFASTKSWSLTGGDGAMSVYARVRDGAGNLSAAGQVDLIFDATPPTFVSGSFLINNDDTFTATGTVTLNLSNVADATSGLYTVEFFNDAATSGSVEAYTTSKSGWALAGSPSPTTPKKVYARIADRAGNTTLLSDDILWDNTQATATLFVNGTSSTPPAVKSPSVTLYYTVTYGSGTITQVCGTNEQSGPNCSLPLPTASGQQKSAAWTLSSGDGTKTIGLTASRSSGASASTKATLILDTVAPVLSTVTPRGLTNGWTNASQVLLDFATSGTETSPITDSCVSTSTTPCTNYAAQTGTTTAASLGAEGTSTLYLRLRDQAGNESAGTTATTVKIDRTAPTFTFKLNNGAAYATDPYVSVDLVSPTDPAGAGGAAASGLSHMVITDDAAGGGYRTVTYLAGTTSYQYKITAVDGTRTVYVRLCDVAGNCTTTTSTIVLDTQPPTGSLALTTANTKTVGTTKYTNSTTVSATATSSETGKFCLSTSATTPTAASACWTALSGKSGSATLTPSAGDGTKTWYAFFMDAAGNIGGPASDFVVVDRTGPTAPSIGTIVTTHHQAYVPWSGASDSGVGIASYELAAAYSSSGPWSYNLATAATATGDTVVDLLDDHTIWLKVRVTDALGNATETFATSAWLMLPFHLVYRAPSTEDLNDVRSLGAMNLAVGNTGLAVASTDSGVTWTRRDMGLDVPWVSVDLDPAGAGKGVALSSLGDVALTTNLGNTWELKRTVVPSPVGVRYLSGSAGTARYVAVGSKRLLIFPTGYIYRPYVYVADVSAYDGTETWTETMYAAASSTRARAMVVCPVVSGNGCPATGLLLVGTDVGAVLVSSDAGTTFAKYSYGDTSDIVSMTRLTGSGSTYFLLTAAGTVWASADTGKTWAKIITLPSTFVAQSVSSTAAGKLLVTGYDQSPKAARVVDYNVACTTTCTATQAASTSLPALSSVAQVAPMTATSVVAVGDRGAIATGTLSGTYTFTNRQPGALYQFGGAAISNSWYWVGGSTTTTTSVVRVSRSNIPVAAGAVPQPSIVQADYGTPYTITGVAALDDANAVAVGYYVSSGNAYPRIFQATTSSSSLTYATPASMTSTLSKLYAVSCAVSSTSAKFCVAVGDNATIATYNGTSWTQLTTFAGGPTYSGVLVYFPTGATQAKVLIVGNDGTNGTVYTATGKTDNSGFTGLPQQVSLGITVPPLTALTRTNAAFVAVGLTGTVLKSTDGGATWAAVSSGTTRNLSAVAASGIYWVAVGQLGTIILSNNDAASFTTLNSLDSVNDFTGVAMTGLAGREIFVSGQNGTVLYSQTRGL